jgi:hypothetical protein
MMEIATHPDGTAGTLEEGKLGSLVLKDLQLVNRPKRKQVRVQVRKTVRRPSYSCSLVPR